MKKNILKISIIVLMMLFISITSLASTLTLDIKSDKEKVTVGEEVKVTVLWDKGMQAADFSLLYNSKLLEYVKADIADDFVNSKENEVKIAWFSLDDTDKTNIEYTFKAKKAGKVEFSTKINGGFATGQLELQENYNNGKLTLKIEDTLINKVIKTVLVIICILIVLLIIRKIKTKKRGTKRRNVVKR